MKHVKAKQAGAKSNPACSKEVKLEHLIVQGNLELAKLKREIAERRARKALVKSEVKAMELKRSAAARKKIKKIKKIKKKSKSAPRSRKA